MRPSLTAQNSPKRMLVTLPVAGMPAQSAANVPTKQPVAETHSLPSNDPPSRM